MFENINTKLTDQSYLGQAIASGDDVEVEQESQAQTEENATESTNSTTLAE